MPRPRLADDAIARALSDLPHWSRDGESLVREFVFPSFQDALTFVNRVADAAEAAQHHPDIDIRYTKVRLSYWTHDAGGITRADIKAAGAVSEIFDGMSASGRQ